MCGGFAVEAEAPEIVDCSLSAAGLTVSMSPVTAGTMSGEAWRYMTAIKTKYHNSMWQWQHESLLILKQEAEAVQNSKCHSVQFGISY